MKVENEFSYLFGHNIISNGLYQAIRNNIVAKKNSFSFFQYGPKKLQSVKLGFVLFIHLSNVYIFKKVFILR